MACNCIEKCNKKLDMEEPGIELNTCIAMVWNPEKPLMYSVIQLGLHRKDGSKKRIKTSLLASYCPFCGTKMDKDKAEQETAS